MAKNKAQEIKREAFQELYNIVQQEIMPTVERCKVAQAYEGNRAVSKTGASRCARVDIAFRGPGFGVLGKTRSLLSLPVSRATEDSGHELR